MTRNGRSILLTALLALILVYLFSIVGFLCLKDDFIMEVDLLPQIAQGQGQLVTPALVQVRTPLTVRLAFDIKDLITSGMLLKGFKGLPQSRCF